MMSGVGGEFRAVDGIGLYKLFGSISENGPKIQPSCKCPAKIRVVIIYIYMYITRIGVPADSAPE